MTVRRKRIAVVSLGVLLLAVLIYESGLATILSDLKMFGPGLILIILIEFLVDAFNSFGWWFTFPRSKPRVTPWTLFLVRLAGTALNQTTPTGSMGGEPAKVMLLQPNVPVDTAIASVITGRLTFSLAKAAFIAIGTVLTWHRLALAHGTSVALFIGFFSTLFGIAIFLLLQLRGFSAMTSRITARLSIPKRWTRHIERISPGVDAAIIDFYRSRFGDFVCSLLMHQFAFLCGVIQVSLLLGWLGLPRDFLTSLAIESFTMLLGFVTFVVPGSIGVQEGGMALIFGALGLPVPAGLAVGIAFRLTSMVGSATGLLVMAGLQARNLQQLPDGA